jgi:Tfp pilus assembly protein FimT
MKSKKRFPWNDRGVGLLEFCFSVALIGMALTVAVPGFTSYMRRMEVNNVVRTVTASLSTARYKAIMKNKRVKWTIEETTGDTGNQVVLKDKQGSYWVEFMTFRLNPNVSCFAKTSPVFSPYGTVSPLCSIYVSNRFYRYKISISMAGRIKVSQLE